mmetsp:Transcript_22741/g.47230  ORF Transcript_22741/g.47230 Transcript_22741/m.47230 type:complete len:105 (-) Transcript_22741:4661-4975(-)
MNYFSCLLVNKNIVAMSVSDAKDVADNGVNSTRSCVHRPCYMPSLQRMRKSLHEEVAKGWRKPFTDLVECLLRTYEEWVDGNRNEEGLKGARSYISTYGSSITR